MLSIFLGKPLKNPARGDNPTVHLDSFPPQAHNGGARSNAFECREVMTKVIFLVRKNDEFLYIMVFIEIFLRICDLKTLPIQNWYIFAFGIVQILE